MKPVSDATAVIVDHGYYVSLAESLAREGGFKKVYYHSPSDSQFQSIGDCIYGDGFDTIERCEDFLSADVLKEIDCFIFPEIGYVPLQKHLRDIGKAVFGSFDATYLEMYRTQFMDFVKDIGLPVAPSKEIQGLDALRDYLKDKNDLWVKVDRLRGDCETFHWTDWAHDEYKLDTLACTWGPLKDRIWFVVQDPIEAVGEIGFDGWCIDGKNPGSTFYGFEGKNEIYLGSQRRYDQLPEPLRLVNEAMAPKLKEMGYRNFIATEIRVTKDSFFYIDPTMRMPGQTGEQLQETCANLADIIWHGSNGELIDPKWNYKFAASATIHYDACEADGWKVLEVPKEVERWTKLCHVCLHNGVRVFPPCHTAELGVVLGCGNTIEETFARLKKNVDTLSDGQPISFALDGFFDLLNDIKESEKAGMKFSDQAIPTKEAILKYTL